METNEWKQLYEQEIERIKNEVSDQQKILGELPPLNLNV